MNRLNVGLALLVAGVMLIVVQPILTFFKEKNSMNLNTHSVLGNMLVAGIIAFAVCYIGRAAINFFWNEKIESAAFSRERIWDSLGEPWIFYFVHKSGNLILLGACVAICIMTTFDGSTAAQYIFEDSLSFNAIPDATTSQTHWFYTLIVYGAVLVFRASAHAPKTAAPAAPAVHP